MKTLFFSLLFIISGMGMAFADPITAQTSSEDKVHFVDEQIMIMADISNDQDTQQNFAYITQVRNDDNVVISLSWLTGSLSPGQSLSPAQSWISAEPGAYHIQVYVWESIDNPSALSPPLFMTVNVNEREI